MIPHKIPCDTALWMIQNMVGHDSLRLILQPMDKARPEKIGPRLLSVA
jgi:hypothetical protein